jgi:hypothetical protein
MKTFWVILCDVFRRELPLNVSKAIIDERVEMAERRILNSWKEIANYLGRGVRTVQRWEVQLGLPVHRPAGKDHSAVLAFSSELDEWLDKRPLRQSPQTDLGDGNAVAHAEEIKAVLLKAEAMLQKLDTLLLRSEETQREVSAILLSLDEERPRRLVRPDGRSRRAEAGAA